MDMFMLTQELDRRGVVFSISNGNLTYQAAMGTLTEDLIAGISQHKAALLERTKSQEPRAALPESHQDALEDAWYRPTRGQLDAWQSYYACCSWYQNQLGDTPACIALEYITDHHDGACCALFTRALRDFYAACQSVTIGSETLEPRGYTERLHDAWQRHDAAAVRRLTAAFMTEQHSKELETEISAWSLDISVPTKPGTLSTNRDDKQPTDSQTDTAEPRKQFGTVFVDIQIGKAITESGVRFTFPAGCELSEFVMHAAAIGPVNRVYVCGERPGGDNAESYINWLMDASMMERYSTSRIGHFFDFQKPDMSVARYQSRSGHGTLDIRRITSWLGDDRDSNDTVLYRIEDARSALLLTTRVLRQHFPLFRHLSGTPSTTFKHLWQQGNHIAKKHFAPLDDDIRQAIHQSSGQGRIEYFEQNCQGKTPGLYYYDGIFMYAALTSELPTELAGHDTINEYAGYTPARYRIRYTVPATWGHVGLFMTKRDGADWRDRDGWFYPGKEYQGQTFETWVDGAELHTLIAHYTCSNICVRGLSEDAHKALLQESRVRDQEHAFNVWNVQILERILFKSTKESTTNKPLETISKKMIDIRNALDNDKRQDSKHARVYDLARGCIRNILLHGIGSFNREQKTRTYILLPGEQSPVALTRKAEYNTLEDGRQIISIPEDTAADEFMHPEFSAAVWARCRARVTKAALSMQYADLVTIRTDAIATKSRQDALEAGTKPGQFRRKWAIEKALACPATHEAFDTLQHKVLGK